MFDVGFFELVILAIVGLLVLGPERLPHAIRMGSAYLGKFRRAVTTVREEFEREVNMKEMQQRIQEQMEKSGAAEAQKSLEDLKQALGGQEISPFGIGNPDAPRPKPQTRPNRAAENTIASTPSGEEADTQHSPTLPENEAEPFPEEQAASEKAAKENASKQESPKA